VNFPEADTPLPAVSPELILSLTEALAKYANTKLVGRNRAYAGPTDGLRNLRHCEAFDVPTEMGIIVRMSDKMQRIRMEAFQPAVPPERLGDSEHGLDNNDLPDLINYCLLLYAVRVIRHKSQDRLTATEFQRGIDHPSPRQFKAGDIMPSRDLSNLSIPLADLHEGSLR
jgi:hypothetical protein